MNPSSLFSGITWDYAGANHLPDAPGSDLWHTLWCNDGNLYTIWGDGGGFTGSNTLGRVEWGVARIEGATYAARSAYNVYGGNNPESAEWPVQGEDPATWKVYHPINVGSWFYAVQADWGYWGDGYYKWRWVKSSDKGEHWTLKDGSAIDQSTWEVASADVVDELRWPALLSMGQGYQSNPFSGYATGFRGKSAGGEMVCRVPFAGITSMGAYEYYVDSATWTKSWSDGTTVRSLYAVEDPVDVYLPTFERYIRTIPTDSNASWAMLDAPNPVGPWTCVGTWGNFIDAGRKFYFLPIDKWCSSGSNEFRMSFSGPNSYDNWWTIKGTFNTYSSSGSEPGSSSPGSYSVSSWSTYTGSQSWVKEVDGADIADYTLMHTAIADQIIAGQIAAGAIGAQEIAAHAILADHIVIGGIAGATVIQSGTIMTDQIGVNEIIAHEANIKNAVVGTLKVAGNAITVPVYSYVSSYITMADSAIMGQIDVTNYGNPLQLTFHATIYLDAGEKLAFNYKRSDNSSVWGIGRIENNSAVTLVAPASIGWSDVTVDSGSSVTLYVYASLANGPSFVCAMPIIRSVEMRR